jgi:hypothetical protein
VVRSRWPRNPLVGWKGYFATLSLSPDGSRLAIAVNTGGRTEVWMKTLPDGPFARLVAGVNNTYRPSWSPDGNEVVFTSDLEGLYGAYRVPADGSRHPTRLVSTNLSVDEAIISRDGKWVVYRQGSGTARHLAAIQVGVDSVGHPLLPGSKAQEYSPTLSPDGHWLAYASDESGRDKVYIRPFPNVERAKYAVSRNGAPSRPGRTAEELFFRTPAEELVAAAIAPGPVPTVTSLKVLFRTDAYQTEVRHRRYAVAPDDSRSCSSSVPDGCAHALGSPRASIRCTAPRSADHERRGGSSCLPHSRGRYRIERGRQGGMANVYLAQDVKHDRRVAIKVLERPSASPARSASFARSKSPRRCSTRISCHCTTQARRAACCSMSCHSWMACRCVTSS